MIGQLNIFLGWLWILMGITSGSIIGMWSFAGPFKTPRNFERYDDLPRRMTRLAHVACFMLPIINILYGEYLDAVPLSVDLKLMGSYSMLVLMFGIPTFLLAASYKIILKYLNVIPVSAGFVGLGIMAYGQWLKFIG